MRSNKHYIWSVCRFSAFHSQISSLGSLQALRQSESKSSQVESSRVKSTQVVDPTSRPPVVHLASKIGWWYILALDKSWFPLSADQIMRWSGYRMEMCFPIGRSIWFGARN
jgi:hypothetical protein